MYTKSFCTKNFSWFFDGYIHIYIFKRSLGYDAKRWLWREKKYNRHRIFTSSILKCSALLSSSSIAMFSKNCMLMAVAMHLIEEESNTFIHSRYRKEFYTLLSELEKSRRYRRIPRCALPLPHDSPWRRVFFSNSDQALITLTGLDFDTFNHLHERFELWFWRYTPFTRDGYIREKKIQGGRPRLLSSFDGLGLVLVWTRTRG